ncbi:MAG: biotin--[acetyl-CoA-carboxylase] ligase [Deltaproteobacteria bacterium]|nr:MAG: biotin--[acetyl-CoA-carboxylase] ligase [Deltaproteobacteria bacterium]
MSPFLPTPATLEWPNDLFWGGKKLAGILTESAITGRRVEFVVVGIGIDVNETNFPAEIPATSMRLAAGREFDRILILEVLYPLLEMWYNHFVAGGLEKIARAWCSRSDIFGRGVTFFRPGTPPISGIAREITKEGALVVETERGIETIHAGEVTGDPTGMG